MSTSQSGGNPIISQSFPNTASSADHVVVVPDQMPYLIVPSTISINNVSGSRSNLMTINNPQNTLNLLPYGDNNMGTQIAADSGVPSSVVPFSFMPTDTLSYHQSDIPMNMMTMEHVPGAPETDDYQERSDFQHYSSLSSLNGSLKPPKRTMSAYACYSRKVFPSVKSRMEGQPRQSDIFREIAKMWKEMTPEEKQPYVEEAKKDRDRKKEDEQRYNNLRKRVERSLEMGSTTLVKMNVLHDNSRGLASLMADHDIRQLASIFLSLNDLDLKSTIDILQDVTTLLSNSPNLETDYSDDVAELDQNHTTGYRCTFPGCNKVFNWKSNLNVHMRIHDANRVRNCVCPEPNCGKRFYDQQHLRQHILTHQKNQHVFLKCIHNSIFPCPYQNCTKKYTTRGGLQLHIKSHHQIDKKFKCDYPNCDRAFVRKTDLRIHKLRVHSDNKPFSCTYQGCDKSYVSQSELNRHYQTHKFAGDTPVTTL